MSMMRVIGSHGYAQVPKGRRKKGELRGVRCVLLGYERGAYRIGLGNNKTAATPNVVFNKLATIPKVVEQKSPTIVDDLDSEDETHADDGGSDSDGDVFHDSVEPQEYAVAQFQDAVAQEVVERQQVGPRVGTRVRRKPEQYGALSVEELPKSEFWIPQSYKEALASPDSELWKAAIVDELKSHSDNGTWTLMELPKDRKAINNLWVFDIKRDSDGKVVQYKARLVAKGFSQREGIDFGEVYAPVISYKSLQTFIAVASAKRWKLHQLDVKTAYLNGTLVEKVYMCVPEGIDDIEDGMVCCLIKALYGLR